MKIFQPKGYKWFVDHYPYTYDSMFKKYRSKLKNKYQWFITLQDKSIWGNGNIEEIFDYLDDKKEKSATIENNWCSDPFKEPVKYLYYNTEYYKDIQKIYGTDDKLIRLCYNTNKFYYCKFKTKQYSFSCCSSFLENEQDYFLTIGKYEYNINNKRRLTIANSNKETIETEDIDKIHKLTELMKAQKYNDLFNKVADRLIKIYNNQINKN